MVDSPKRKWQWNRAKCREPTKPLILHLYQTSVINGNLRYTTTEGEISMKTIYENYRGFKINKDHSTYNAIHADQIIFAQAPLSQVLDSIDQYIDGTNNSATSNESTTFPQN